MRIPRYRLYWEASGLWALRGIYLRGAIIVLLMFIGYPAAHFVENPWWRYLALAGVIAATVAAAFWAPHLPRARRSKS